MDTNQIIQELEAERDRLNEAIAALQGSPKRFGSPKGSTVGMNGRKGRRRLSAAARRKISIAQKARWKKVKASGKTT